MSILGYSSAYFLPQYWVNTPLYGEKIIPLLDYILSTDYAHTEKLATAFYDIESKYKNTQDLPIDKIEAIIEESGYGYVRNLLGQDSESLKLLVYILVMVHQLKGSKRGIETVMQLLRSPEEPMEQGVTGNVDISSTYDVSGFSENDYVILSNFNAGNGSFDLKFKIRTGNFDKNQCIASSDNYGFYLGLDTEGHLVLRVGENNSGQRNWQVVSGNSIFKSTRVLLKNTNYYIKFLFSEDEYVVQVSTDDDKYLFYVNVNSSTPLSIYSGRIYLGVDKSTGNAKEPFSGEISLLTFSATSNSTKITQWYEMSPVGEENTFYLDAEVDLSLVNVDFFENLAKFLEKYVYPTLGALKAKLAFRSKVTFLPYVRQKVTYVASNINSGMERFYVRNEKYPDDNNKRVIYEVKKESGAREDFWVVIPPKDSNEDDSKQDE